MPVQSNQLNIFLGKPKNSINLLFNDGVKHTSLGQIILWAITTGRVIVILVELTVIVAFLSRFWIDNKLTNLNEDNHKKIDQIKLSANFENDFRAIQNRLASYNTINSTNLKASNEIENISQFIPEDIVLTKLDFTKNTVQIKGKTFTDHGLAVFIKGINSSKKYTSVEIVDVTIESNNNTFGFLLKAEKEKQIEAPVIEEKTTNDENELNL